MSTIKASVPDELRAASEAIFRQIGTDMPGAIRMFLAQVVMQHGLPFQPMVSRELSAQTLSAIAESYSGGMETVKGGVTAMLDELDD